MLGWYGYWDQDAFGHPDNYCMANAMVTPAFIAPEWYFLPFYGVIRAIPHKALGIVVMVVMIVSLLSLGGMGLRWSSMTLVCSSVRSGIVLFVVDMWIVSYV